MAKRAARIGDKVLDITREINGKRVHVHGFVIGPQFEDPHGNPGFRLRFLLEAKLDADNFEPCLCPELQVNKLFIDVVLDHKWGKENTVNIPNEGVFVYLEDTTYSPDLGELLRRVTQDVQEELNYLDDMIKVKNHVSSQLREKLATLQIEE